jgi:superfamily II DNA or RNA helicase
MNGLRDNQINAMLKFEEYFYNKSNNRGILSMCCGSGKTRTFYEILKKCINDHNEDFFIYTTSRILLVQGIVQELIEWIYFEEIPIDILIKVSEFNIKDIKKNILSKYNNNTYFNKTNFNDFFNKFNKNNIKLMENDDIIDIFKARYILEQKNILIITTYDSIKSIIEAINYYNNNETIKKMIIPDLLVCDESHNLVSNDNDLKIAKLILEENEGEDGIKFEPSKYLFMTATPLKIIKRNKNDDFKNDDITYTMSNEDKYGKVFFEYTFYEGIRDKYILDFDVIYLTDLDSNDEDNKLALEELKYIDDKKEQQEIYFNIVARYLLKTINMYNLKHTLVYLSNKSKVNCLLNILNKEIEKENLSNKIGYIISDQCKKEREINKNNFETYDGTSKILLSVDIFNEGIDIPICDSILFAEERNSETVIAQNIGRSLRKYNNINYNKQKAYVILPTKIYTINNNESAFSSKFKKIREICDILREPPEINNPRYFTRKTKGNLKKLKNLNDDEDINEESGLIDNIISINDNNNIYVNNDNLNNERINKCNEISNIIFNSFEIESSSDKLSNIKLDILKKIIQKENIKDLFNLSKFTKNNYAIDKPHLYYKSDWICYGDFLFNKVYSFDESIEIIKSLNINNIKSPKEWIEYYNSYLDLGFKNECSNDDLLILNKIIYIPYDPKTYYLTDWIRNNENEYGWSIFLGKELINNTIIEINSNKSSISLNASTNLKNLVNQDKFLIKKLIKEDWQTFENIKTDITPLKLWIDNYFSIDSRIDLRYRLTNTYALNSKVFNIYINNKLLIKPPIVLDFSYKCKYDKTIFNDINSLLKKEIIRDHEIYIQPKSICNIIDNIKNELIEYININKQNIL